MGRLASDLVGLYAHIPFCSLKCFYCDFAAVAHHGHLAGRYLAALEREAASKPKYRFDTVYVGGGTPSELSAPQITELFERLRRAYPGLSPVETTFEANPESLDEEKLAALKAAGVTRLSIGLQTADDAQLKGIGRRHTVADFERVYRMAKGFDRSIDLMYGLPGQTLESLERTLDFVLALDPEHLSLYGLQVEDQTLFARRGVEADEELGRAMFELALTRIAAAGYRHYEVSNFAKPGHEAKHNLIYWKNGEYVGLGCGAASYVRGERTMNLDRLQDYLAAVEGGKSPVADAEVLVGKDKLGESFMLGLRLIDGFRPTPEMRSAFAREIDLLERRGLIKDFRLTRDGLFVANDVFREFVPPYAEAVNP